MVCWEGKHGSSGVLGASIPCAVVVVSHDRFFIDKVANRLLVFEGGGMVRDIPGIWTTWQASIG